MLYDIVTMKFGGSWWGAYDKLDSPIFVDVASRISNGNGEQVCLSCPGLYTQIPKVFQDTASEIAAMKNEHGINFALVPSGPGNYTDLLRDIAAKKLGVEPSELQQCAESDAIIGLGEILASYMLQSALTSEGIHSVIYDPRGENFPVRTNEKGEVDVEESCKMLKNVAEECFNSGYVLILPGFVGQYSNIMSTIGRNGSDYSQKIADKAMKELLQGKKNRVMVKIGAAPGISDGNGGYLDQVSARELLSCGWNNGTGYNKADCPIDPRALEDFEDSVMLVTNRVGAIANGQEGTWIFP